MGCKQYNYHKAMPYFVEELCTNIPLKSFDNLFENAVLFIKMYFLKHLSMLIRYGSTKSTHVFLKLQKTIRTEKITSREPSAVPAPGPRKFQTRWSSLWLFPAPPHARTLQAGTHNEARNLPENKKFKQMQYLQTCLMTARQ